MMRTGLVNMGIGLAIAAIGIIITAASYSAVSHSGGTYVVTWGAMAIGAWRFLLGLSQLIRGGANAPAAPFAPAETVTASRSYAGAGAPTSPIAGISDQMAGPVLVIGVLLIIQALVRLGFLANLLLHLRIELLSYPQFLLFSIAMPVVLAVGGLVAGGLVFTRYALWREIGLAYCTVGLLYQLFGVGSLVITTWNRTGYQLPWFTLALIGFNFVIYIAGLIVFGLSFRQRATASASP
jgi:hypothetical protein